MRLATQHLLPFVAIVAACGGGASDSSSAVTGIASTAQANAPVGPSNASIAALVYDSGYSVPADFFVDERASTHRSYTVHHVLDDSNSYERCTDDYAVAHAWEDADNAARSVQGYFVESYDNARYFEFVRELAYDDDIGNVDDLTSPGFARIFKCSNTDRDGVDRSLLNGYAGRLNAAPLNSVLVREFAEYLWQFTFFPQGRKKVIDSSASSDATHYQQTLLLAFSNSQGTGRCDLIEVAEWRFTADRSSGEVHKSFSVLRHFEAERVDGDVRLC
ncbi:MAG: hypothetical protein KJO82_03385 [Gammaproteobacteria bacterium]|nr:hypothetical protein [Gammaproteobacteria bacterium]